MTKDVVTLIDQSGVEVLVAYTLTGGEIELTSVEIVIAGRGIDILKAMDIRQLRAIEDEVLATV